MTYLYYNFPLFFCKAKIKPAKQKRIAFIIEKGSHERNTFL